MCGDRIRVQLRVVDGTIDDARFTADACAICIASASVLTEHVRGMRVSDAARSTLRWIHASLEGEPPAGRVEVLDAAARHAASRTERVGRRGVMIAGLLLAAGGARRFGSQKLVATLDDVPLVRHAAQALAQETDELIVVVGSESAAVTRALDGIDARIVENAEWERGLSTSIRCGVCAVKQNTTAIVVALGDEPRVDGAVSRALIAEWRESGRPIVVARYAGEIGHPILFDRRSFPNSMALDGDRGARGVIQRSPDRVAYVDMTTAPPLDVDEPNDLRRLADGIWYPRRENAP